MNGNVAVETRRNATVGGASAGSGTWLVDTTVNWRVIVVWWTRFCYINCWTTSLTEQTSKACTHNQWRRLYGARGHVPPLLQMAGHGGTVSRRTAKKILTKLYWPPRKRSPKRLLLYFYNQRSGGARPKKIFAALLRRIIAPIFAPDRDPYFEIRSGATNTTSHPHAISVPFVPTQFEYVECAYRHTIVPTDCNANCSSDRSVYFTVGRHILRPSPPLLHAVCRWEVGLGNGMVPVVVVRGMGWVGTQAYAPVV